MRLSGGSGINRVDRFSLACKLTPWAILTLIWLGSHDPRTVSSAGRGASSCSSVVDRHAPARGVAPPQDVIANSRMEEFEEFSLRQWIDRLVFVESRHRWLVKKLDRNGKYSYGCLQFQEATFIQQMRLHNLLATSDAALIMGRIYDCELQKKLTGAMIKADYNNWRHWRTSIQRIGLPPAVLGRQ